MERKLKEILARVFNLESPDTIRPTDSLVDDLGADSLDFVEMLHLIERSFGVVLRTKEIFLGTGSLSEEEIFLEGRLTREGVVRLGEVFHERRDRLREGMAKAELFSLLTVADLEAILRAKLAAGVPHA